MPVALGVNGGVLGSNNLPTATTFRGVFTPNEVARAIALGFWPVNKSQAVTGVAGSGALGTLTVGATADPYFEYTTLLLPGNGTNGAQNNTFLDGSTNNFTITRNGNTTQGTFSPFSQTGWGNYFNGSSALLNTTTASSGFNLSTGSFTIEGWVYLTSVTSYQYLINLANTAGSVSGLVFGINSSGQPYIGNGVVLGKSGSTAISANTWTHIAVVSDGTNIQFYTNGSSNGSAQAFSPNSAQYFYVGRDATGSNALTGYISNLRVTKGRAVYSGSSYVVPTSSLTRTTGGSNPPQGTECSLLTCQSNSFLDSNGVNVPASSPLTITATGSPTVQAFSPFNPTASWSAATYGGSGYFDGNGDYLTFGPTASIGTSAFTIEAWVYLTATPTSRGLWGTNTSANGGFTIRINSTTQIALDVTGGGGTNFTVPTINLNEWVHIACVRDGSNNTTVFTNGVRSSSGALTVTTNFSYLAGLGLIFPGTTNPPTGYIASARILTGSAVYDPTQTTCTVPTAPLTAISGTQFLCNFTNAGIYDATSKNDLETVGNAQISTTQSKFGGSSMSFDGTGDYLYDAPSPFIRLGTGDFTIESWVYFNTLTNASNTMGVFQLADSYLQAAQANNGVGVTTTSQTGWLFYAKNTQTFTTSPPVPAVAGQWMHVALVRYSGTTKLYVNGTGGASLTATTDTTNYTATYLALGGAYGGNALNGYLQDFRITVGIARYTANFTAPTAAFPTL